MTINLYQGDIPSHLDLGKSIAIDTETMGLNSLRDRLCLIQISSGDGNAHLVQFKPNSYDAPNLKKLLSNPEVEKIFHYARFDVAAILIYLDVLVENIYCTKIASKLARTFAGSHGLKANCADVLGVDLSKQQQTSDWGAEQLTEKQLEYAASDVLYLHKLKEKLDEMLTREDRIDLAYSCFDFIPTRTMLDISGWEEDIFDH